MNWKLLEGSGSFYYRALSVIHGATIRENSPTSELLSAQMYLK